MCDVLAMLRVDIFSPPPQIIIIIKLQPMELYGFFLTDQPTKVERLSHSHDLTNHRSQKYVESVILKGRRKEGIQKFR